MKYFGGTAPRKTGINITSLIDVIFMLVIFFMIGASFEKPSIAVALPKASSGESRPGDFITVTIDSGGGIYAEGNAIDREGLLGALAERRSQRPDIHVALECDAAVSFGAAAAVMDIIKKAGIRNVAIRHDFEE
ncbi:MAG: biopolymer transporter ExbD [Treponema sp.]|jgi:biopolymer transport protein ExbD|nr:biopolymer transporter ExbD [Treponema sp.]